jgi:YesN/AraC family two-component response regulator
MNGIEASTKIKSSQPKSKIIAVSAFNDSDTINEALNAGCIDFISKPFDKNTLINLMCRYV